MHVTAQAFRAGRTAGSDVWEGGDPRPSAGEEERPITAQAFRAGRTAGSDVWEDGDPRPSAGEKERPRESEGMAQAAGICTTGCIHVPAGRTGSSGPV